MTGYTPETLKRAKGLRREMTEAEQRLWSHLRAGRLGEAKFRRQQPIGPFIADFVCQEARLVVEADGGQHAQSESDRRRTAFLEGKGYRVLRFWNNEVLADTDAVLRVIAEAVALSPTPLPRPSPSRGEGRTSNRFFRHH